MAMTIMNDASAAMTLGELNKNISQLGKQLKKVSSGQRINGAGDAPSEYSISEKMRVRIRALDQDERNVQNGAALLHIAEGAIQSQIEIMKTIKEKVIDADNDTNTDLDRATIQKEIDQGYQQIQDIAWETNYNGKLLLVGDKQIEEIYTWKILDEPTTIPDSIMNIVPDEYAELDGIAGPFAAFTPYTAEVSTAAPLLGANSSVNYSGGVNGYYDPPTEPTRATFTMDLSGYGSAAALDGVGFVSGGRYYVLTSDTSKNYKTNNGYSPTKININGCSSTADVAQRIAAANLYGTASASASGSTITFKTSGTGTGANTTSPPITGWSATASDVQGYSGGSSAKRGRESASPTGIGSDTVRGQNAQTHNEQYLISAEYVDENDVYHAAVYGTRLVEDSPATGATMTKNISSAANGSGIVVNGAYIRFVDGNSEFSRLEDGTYTVGKNATVNNFSLRSWNNTPNDGGSTVGVTFSLSGGQMTLKTTSTGYSAYISVMDGFSGVEPQPAVAPTPTTTHYENVTALNDGIVSNATGAVNRGQYHPAVSATYDINLKNYNITELPGDTPKLNEFIEALKGKVMSITSADYEFIDSTVPTSIDAQPQTKGSSLVDLKDLRTAVEGRSTIADAFINLMTGKNSRFSDASSGDDKILRVAAANAGEVGNAQTISISKGTLSQRTVDFKSFFEGEGSGLRIPEDLQDKGFRIYCATCDDQWFNFQFSLGGELDATRPASGSSGADLKTTIINVAEVTDVESLVQAIYDQAQPAMETIKDGHSHTLHVAANPKEGTVTFYDHRLYDPRTRPDLHPHAKEQGAKIADGVMDDVIKMTRGVYVKDLVIQHTDHASQNIHVRVPQTTLDHLFNYIEGAAGGISDYNVMTTESREKLLGNKAGKKRSGGIAPEDEKGALDTALDYLTSANTLVGAQIMRLEMTQANIVTSRESTTNSESTIRDADMAKEMTDYTKANVLAQAAQSMLAQANQSSSGVLSLLQ